ncbi:MULTISPECIES: VOC family protein [Vagococcus]|uniref:Putative quinone binding protein n=1 Tax=Vagococcus fluvialis bH819 TaxID=1255619 RepID=A0A1X6WQL5_9ENTE|nr:MULTISPECIES: VOC family protein [Vagococcus]SLM86594.1 putative quinone binding protein [Vagococcus fluvialis bH819]HCM90802.1 glyoxylase [Vagococcus sp.]
MKLDMVGIIVNDMKQAIAFYSLLRLKIMIGNENEAYVELENEGVRISLNTKEMITSVLGFEPEQTGDKVELAFLCDSQNEVDNLVASIKIAGYEVVREPWSAPWGQYYGLVRDSDGNIISLFVNE